MKVQDFDITEICVHHTSNPAYYYDEIFAKDDNTIIIVKPSIEIGFYTFTSYVPGECIAQAHEKLEITSFKEFIYALELMYVIAKITSHTVTLAYYGENKFTGFNIYQEIKRINSLDEPEIG